MNRIAIFLCDITGKMAAPWVEAGYDVVLVDPQHPAGINTEGQITRVGCIITDALDYLGAVIRTGRVVFVMGFPPCTDVAVSGSRWFEAKRQKDPHFQAKAALVAEQCRMIGALSGAPWAFENPVSVFSSIFGKAQHFFSPEDFTGHCANDNYTKKTCLWTGGGFVMPDPFRDLTLGKPDDRIHKCAPGPERANIRSATPEGFSIATFLANAPHLKAPANDNSPADSAADDRAKFEAYQRSECKKDNRDLQRSAEYATKITGCDYILGDVESAWKSWKDSTSKKSEAA